MQHAWNLLIATHAIAAAYAMIFGAVNLIRKPKGDRPHRAIGFIWLGSMYFVIISSFWIKLIRDGQFSWIHGLSVFTFITISLGLYSAVTHNIKSHKAFMTGSYFGLLGAFIGVVAVPSRLIPQMVVRDTLQFAVITICIVLSSVFFVVALLHLQKSKRTTAP